MKKNTLILITIVFSMMLCGCGASVPDMTEAQKAVVTEYATNLLVKYSTVSNRSLLNDEELEAGIAKEEEERQRLLKVKEMEELYLSGKADEKKPVDQEKSDNDNAEESQWDETVSVPQLSVAQFFEESAFSIDYSSYILCQSYPEENGEEFFMAMDATQGKQLCVVKFDVANVSGTDQSLDMYAKKGRFSLQLGDGTVVKAQTTLLMDDLSS